MCREINDIIHKLYCYVMLDYTRATLDLPSEHDFIAEFLKTKILAGKERNKV